MTKAQLKRRIKSIEDRMIEAEDAGGLIGELQELRTELRDLEK